MKKPNFFKRMIMLSVSMWRVVMNVKYNPLKYVPCPVLQSYFMLVLFVIWSVFFGFIATVYLGLVNYSTIASILIHLSVLVPLVITNAVFIDAERDGHKWLIEWEAEQSKYKLFTNRLKVKNTVIWKPKIFQ
jgi:hypothetical protein|tara:strand:- start:735 stop:1130 length:396 start_codon:yes stop_codon:yes gene_type:complete